MNVTPATTAPQPEESLTAVTYVIFVGLAGVCALTHFWARRTKSQLSSGNNPNFRQFQIQFFVVYFLALLSDWLQGPYVYKLYSYYGFAESQIAVLYVIGFASSVLFGTSTGTLADRFGRKKMCIAFSVMYSLCCFTKLFGNFYILLLGRVFGGIATSMLFSSFESWYVHEHVERHDFPTEWLPVTFSKITFWNGILAINAGIVANVSADTFGLGPVAPFMIAIPCLVVGGIVVFQTWPENYGNVKTRFCVSCKEGLRHILFNEKILLLGITQSLFESVMYMFVFLWTPILDSGHPPLGLIFSCFMICIMIGSSLYQVFLSQGYNSQHTLTLSVVLSLLSMVICTYSSNAHNPNLYLSFAAFLILELAVGLYFPSVGFLRSRIIPESHRASIMNWFRVPMNVITCGGLLWLHTESNHHGNQAIFIICAGLMAIALLTVKLFTQKVSKDDLIEQEGIISKG